MGWTHGFPTVTGAGDCPSTLTRKWWGRVNNVYYRIVSVYFPVKPLLLFSKNCVRRLLYKNPGCVKWHLKQVTFFRIIKPNLALSWLSPLMPVSRSPVHRMAEPCTEAHRAVENLSALWKKLPHWRFDVLCSNTQALPPDSDCSSPIRRINNHITPVLQSQLRCCNSQGLDRNTELLHEEVIWGAMDWKI